MGDVSDLVGTVIADKYVVDRVIGRGGMGTVLRATHSDLRKPVAIKVLHVEGPEDREATVRFVREARAAAHVASEHVAQVFDVGRLDSGAPYMVMEYLAGRDLLEELRDHGPMDVERATDVLLQAAEAVAHAHSIGVIHRDLKPANLFLVPARDGSQVVKVLDFGISRAKEEVEASITESSSMLGSPQYMAPEQIRNPRLADERADIWSLGVILYELLTAQQPFVGSTPSGILAAIVADPHVPLLEQNSGLPERLSDVIDRCLEKLPESRFQNVGELAQALEPLAPSSRRELVASIVSILQSPPSERPPLSPSESALRISDLPAQDTNPRGISSGTLTQQGGTPTPKPEGKGSATHGRRRPYGRTSGSDTLKEASRPKHGPPPHPTLRSDTPLDLPLRRTKQGRIWVPLLGAVTLLVASTYVLGPVRTETAEPAGASALPRQPGSRSESKPGTGEANQSSRTAPLVSVGNEPPSEASTLGADRTPPPGGTTAQPLATTPSRHPSPPRPPVRAGSVTSAAQGTDLLEGNSLAPPPPRKPAVEPTPGPDSPASPEPGLAAVEDRATAAGDEDTPAIDPLATRH